ncbi:MAG: DUF1792 domain-containing protein [Lachnospiraceae bacterium]|nr:DUF1792 domain-containing protein [Lachnospiraceae bacterium]
MKIAVIGGRKRIREINRVFKEKTEIMFLLDNNVQLAGKEADGIQVYTPYDFPKDEIDYIYVFMYENEAVRQELIDLGMDYDRIVCFSNLDLELPEYEKIFHIDAADRLQMRIKTDYLVSRIRQMDEAYQYFEQNYVYEAADRFRNRKIILPKVSSVESTCEKIISDKCSMSRYGDGEFEIILGHAKDIYQDNDDDLAKRLREILLSDLDNHIVALADDYGAMEGLRRKNRNTIRRYMTEEKRKKHYALLNMDKEYYNAYISRPYVIYPHNEIDRAKERFDDLKRIWAGRNVLLIEGSSTRMGVGNDLFTNTESIQRMIAPNENAYRVYNEIYHAALQYGQNKLILIALGPTATVLAYDLAKAGYWALDIGHLDLEYEWFLKGKGYSYVPCKYNNEMLGDTTVIDIQDEEYEKSIICFLDGKNTNIT